MSALFVLPSTGPQVHNSTFIALKVASVQITTYFSSILATLLGYRYIIFHNIIPYYMNSTLRII